MFLGVYNGAECVVVSQCLGEVIGDTCLTFEQANARGYRHWSNSAVAGAVAGGITSVPIAMRVGSARPVVQFVWSTLL